MSIKTYVGGGQKNKRYWDVYDIGKEGRIEGIEEQELYCLARCIISELNNRIHLENIIEDAEIRLGDL